MEDHADIAVLGHQADPPVRGIDCATVDLDGAAVGTLQPSDAPQQRGLAAAAGAEENDELARMDLERDTIDGGHNALVRAAEELAQALDAKDRGGVDAAVGRGAGDGNHGQPPARIAVRERSVRRVSAIIATTMVALTKVSAVERAASVAKDPPW